MQGSGGRRAITRTGVAAGSVWETRMRMDEVKGGIKVFNGEESRGDDEGNGGDEDSPRASSRRLRRNQSDGVAATERRKRKNWKPPEAAAVGNGPIDRSPIQLRKARSDLSNSPRTSNVNSRRFGGDKIAFSGSGNTGGIGETGVLLIGDGGEGGGEDAVGLQEAEIKMEAERNSFDDKEIDLPPEKPKNSVEEKRINQIHEIPLSPIIEKPQSPPPLPPPPPPPVVHHRKKYRNPMKPPPVEVAEEMFESTSGSPNQMQNVVDLIMWRDVSRSAFIFGIGSFILLSSSYTKDLNFSPISAISYLGLVYLAAIFLYKSILRRGGVADSDERGERHMVGEKEAIWLVRLLLPYVNELLLKIRALFSGDPETTMKVAVLLFVTARCGSSITIWALARLVFFGVFTVPKVCSSYSFHLARYGKFWLERLRDGWESCTHKKAVAAAIFTLIWNLSSVVARVWAVFMLVVAVRFYQQRGMEGWSAEAEEVEGEAEAVVEERQEDSKVGRECHRQKGGPTLMGIGGEVKMKRVR